MKLKSRLVKLENVLQTGDHSESETKQIREQVKAWMDNDPEAIPLFKKYEAYCHSKGYRFNEEEREEAAKTDPVVADLQQKWQTSYLKYVNGEMIR